MRIFSLHQITPALWKELRARPWERDEQAKRSAQDICLDVKQRGDDALKLYTERFDNAIVSDFRVSSSEFEAAREKLSRDLVEAIQIAASNIRTFHTAQIKREDPIQVLPGVTCWRERRPIDHVGLYVPAGSAPLPSTVLMLGIPARIAGCAHIVICTPQNRNGAVDPAVLAAAENVGISEIYKVGGAQAIAAMAYGTESIPKVNKIFGPGNQYVTAAKQFVSSDPDGAAIDLLAGPSELLIVADQHADARIVAADLLSQAEHDPHSQVVLLSTSDTLPRDVERYLNRQLGETPRRDIAARALENSYMVVVDSLERAMELSNDYAPEHLIVNMRDPERVVPLIQNAGSVFLGPYAPVTAGDYASGTNHTLPTGGTAKWSSGVSVESFQKTLTFQRILPEGLERLAPTLTALARSEGLEAHERAVTIRLVGS